MPERTVPAAPPVDRYEVLDFLAEGGMGAIYLGKKLGAGGFEKQVVLKQLRPEYTEQPEFIELFLREAKLSASLDHANIVHTIDLVHSGHDYFIVMEYVRGGDLRMLLKRAKRRKRRLSPAAALFIGREMLTALAYAHNRKGPDGQPLGLIHRDVSPSNILLSAAGEVKLTDFGIAKATTFRSAFFRVRGKVGYMSPEQARSQPLLPCSDLYSVGVILYEMLTGERLHVVASLTTSADEIYAAPVPSVSQKVPGLPADLDAVLWKALAVNAEARYQSAGEMLAALRPIVSLASLGHDADELSRHLVEVCGPAEEWGSSVVKEPVLETSGQATAGLPPDEESGGESSNDLLWVDRDRALPRTRAPSIDGGRFASAELRPVEEFIADRVVEVEPSVTRPPRRLGRLLALLGGAAALAAAAIALGAGRRERPVAPPVAPAPAPPRAEPRKPAKLAVETEPARARVLVDGQVRCLTPCTVDVMTGEARRIEVDAAGYVRWTTLVIAQAGDPPLKIRLRRAPASPEAWGSVVLRGAGPANVLVNGKPIGYAAPAEEPLALPPGEQLLTLLPPGATAGRELRVTIKAGAVSEVDVP